jgi:hypothetical protein
MNNDNFKPSNPFSRFVQEKRETPLRTRGSQAATEGDREKLPEKVQRPS